MGAFVPLRDGVGRHFVQLDLQVVARFVQARVGSHARDDFGFHDALGLRGPLAVGLNGQEHGFCATGRQAAYGAHGSAVDHVGDHGHDFGFVPEVGKACEDGVEEAGTDGRRTCARF